MKCSPDPLRHLREDIEAIREKLRKARDTWENKDELINEVRELSKISLKIKHLETEKRSTRIKKILVIMDKDTASKLEKFERPFPYLPTVFQISMKLYFCVG